MDITTRDRAELKKYFVKNSIPTEENFAELIDGMLNQTEDGLVKLPGNPLSIEAAGDNTSQKKAINFYHSFADATPIWSLSLNPRSDPSTPDTAQLGLSISDGVGNSRLFIDQATGRVGVGTTSPAAKLDVAAATRTGTHPTGGPLYVTGNIGADSGGIEFRHSNGSQGIGFGNNTIYATGSNTNQDLGLKPRGTGSVVVDGPLRVDGKYVVQNRVDGGNTRGIWMWHADDSNWGMYMAQSGDGRSLAGGRAVAGAGFSAQAIRLRTSAASQGLIYENASEQLNLSIRGSDGLTYIRGNVGIGTTDPGSYKLNIGSTEGQTVLHLASDFGLRGNDKLNLIRFGSDGDYQILHNDSGAFGRNTLGVHVHSDDAFGVYSTDWTSLLEVAGASGDLYVRGNVGIGTTNPGATLDVNGNIQINGAIVAPEGTLRDNGGGWVRTYGNTGWYNQTHAGGWYMTDTTWIRSVNNKSIYQNTGILRTDGIFQVGSDGNRFVVNTSGNVGIGTNAPGTSKLKIANSATDFADFRFADSGTGQLEMVGWSGGWNINAKTDGKHLHLNRDAGSQSNALIGRNGKELFVRGSDGNVGIGTTSPTQAKLVVEGHDATEVVDGYGYLNRNEASTSMNPGPHNYSIWCSQRLAASEFNAVSDGRIKNVIGVSDSRQDLETLTTLQVTDYTFIDVVNKGQDSNKKLIAQQVQRVYPIAVHTTEDFIPHVYAMSASSMHDGEHGHLTITTGKTHSVVAGDTVRIIDDTGTQELEVLSVRDEHTFTVASDRAAENVFVYGKRVDDFLVLDYEAIAMLNVSATQELVKRVDSQQSRIAKLEDENAFLKTKLADIQVEVTDDFCPAGKRSVAVHGGR